MNLFISKKRIERSENRHTHFDLAERKSLVDKYNEKYNSKTVVDRLRNRRGIYNKSKELVSSILSVFLQDCPYKTGNGKLNGILYTLTKVGTATIRIGGLLAPYLIHLSYPVTVTPSIHEGWVENSWNKARRIANQYNFTLTKPSVSYGIVYMYLYPNS